MTATRFIYPTTVSRIHERVRVARAYRNEAGEAVSEYETEGWAVVVLGGLFSFPVPEKPKVQPGAEVRVILEIPNANT